MHVDAYALMRPNGTSEKIWSYESGWSAHEFNVLIMLFNQILLVITSTVVLFFVRWIFDVFAKFEDFKAILIRNFKKTSKIQRTKNRITVNVITNNI